LPYSDALARSSASDGVVLLKNDGTLPLKIEFNRNQTVALIGMWANDTASRMLGNYYGRPPVYHTPFYAAQQLGLQVIMTDGPVNKTDNFSAALAAAKLSDIILYFGGIDTSIESEDRDRISIAWPDTQLTLLRELSALNKTIVVVQLGTQVDNTPLLSNRNINSILWTGYPGMHGGPAVFDIITGAKAPAARLPITQYPASYVNEVAMTDMSLRPSAKNPGRTYKWFSDAVQEFGFGLHYTNFSVKFGPPYGNIQDMKHNPPVFQIDEILKGCKETYLDLCPFPSFPVVVMNTGTVTSDFVLLGFLSTKQGPAPHPLKELAFYKRIRDIKGREMRNTELKLTLGDFSRVDESGNTVLFEGAYCLGLDVPEQARLCFEVLGGDRVLDVWPQPKGK